RVTFPKSAGAPPGAPALPLSARFFLALARRPGSRKMPQPTRSVRGAYCSREHARLPRRKGVDSMLERRRNSAARLGARALLVAGLVLGLAPSLRAQDTGDDIRSLEKTFQTVAKSA